MEPIGIIANIGPAELGIVLAIILLLFGAAKLPKLARSLGQAQREFKKGLTENIEADNSGSSSHDSTTETSHTTQTAASAENDAASPDDTQHENTARKASSGAAPTSEN